MSTIAPTNATIGLKASHHTDLENHIREFQRKLGDDWEKYQETLSLFLIGKLSRTEMMETIGPLLKNGLVKFHNKFLLMNFANSLKDGNLDFSNGFASFWNKKASKSKNVKSSQYEKFKQNIMGLPIRERRRIKSITRESGKRGKLSASITLTRHALLPKIPMIQDKAQQQSHVNNLVSWQQDVVNGINTPIATDNYEIPDYDNLSRRMIMTMREHGLTGGLNPQVMEVISLGLEIYLKNILESAIDVARYRENKYASNDYLTSDDNDANNDIVTTTSCKEIPQSRKNEKITLHAEDMYDTLELFPHLVEPGGPRLRLANIMLQNDDMINLNSPNYSLPEKSTSGSLINDTINGSMTKNSHIRGLERDKNLVEQNKSLEANSASTSKPTSTDPTESINELKWLLHDLIS